MLFLMFSLLVTGIHFIIDLMLIFITYIREFINFCYAKNIDNPLKI